MQLTLKPCHEKKQWLHAVFSSVNKIQVTFYVLSQPRSEGTIDKFMSVRTYIFLPI